MKILQILNNNVIVSNDENNQETIVMGRGIAFSKHLGETIDEGRIQKTFVLKDEEMHTVFTKLLLNTPIEYFDLAEEIIQYAKLTLNKKMNDNIYVTLVDHIYSSIQRYQDNILLTNVLKWEIQQFYKDEYKVGEYALTLIEKKYKIHMESDEAAFIALHLVTAELDDTIPQVFKITTFMKEIIKIVEDYFIIKMDEKSLTYFRFVTHLKYFSQRLFNHNLYYDSEDFALFEMIKTRYTKEYACLHKIDEFLKEKYDHTLTLDESIYLTIHIAKVVKEAL